jgi:dynein heavy chain
MDVNEVTRDKIDVITSNFLTHPEWDPVGAGKIISLAEILAKWVIAIKEHHLKKADLAPLLERLETMKETYAHESARSAEQWKGLEADEQNLERLKEEQEKMEREKNQLNQDKATCKDKLEKGKKLLEELTAESDSWTIELTTISEQFEKLLGNVLILAASICILPAFRYEKR